ncbi:MAG: SH3 domain-containing protein [Clostridiales bacterium]|nr:SH3 domain-containing protein [Clostridiales bacterium]
MSAGYAMEGRGIACLSEACYNTKKMRFEERMKMKRLFAAFLMIVLVCMVCASAFAVEYPCEGTVNAMSVRVRKTSSTSGKKVAELDKGEVVTVLEEVVKKNGDIWYQVETPKGKKGYILSDYLCVPEIARIKAAEESPDGVLTKMTITATCGNFNGVGKNWTQYYEWNGLQVVDGKMEAYVAPEVELTVYSRIRERDSKPDTGTEKLVYIPTEEEVQNGFAITQTVKVMENSGKHKGKIATWQVTYSFEAVE